MMGAAVLQALCRRAESSCASASAVSLCLCAREAAEWARVGASLAGEVGQSVRRASEKRGADFLEHYFLFFPEKNDVEARALFEE